MCQSPQSRYALWCSAARRDPARTGGTPRTGCSSRHFPGSHTTETEMTPTVGKPGRYFYRKNQTSSDGTDRDFTAAASSTRLPGSRPNRADARRAGLVTRPERDGLAWGGRGTTRTFSPLVLVDLLTLTEPGGRRWPSRPPTCSSRGAEAGGDRATPTGRELAGGWVAVTGGLVVRGGRRRPSPARGRAETLDASGCLVTPGLVNTHHHIYQNLTRAYRPAINGSLFAWLTTLYPLLGRPGRGGRLPVGLGRAGRAGARRLHHLDDHLYVAPARRRRPDLRRDRGRARARHALPPDARAR